MKDFWEELGLEPTTDLRAIRHAYAQRAKSCHPEEAPEEFQRLHSAYESACQWARSQGEPSAESPSPQPEGPAPSDDSEAEEIERLVAAGLRKKEQKDLERYGSAIGSLYRLFRDPDARENLQNWQTLLQSSTFCGLCGEAEFYPYLHRFLKDHYKELPDAAWPAIRDAFSLGKINAPPEMAELRKLVLPRCQNTLRKRESKAAPNKRKERKLDVWPLLVILFLVVAFRDTEHAVLLAVLLAALTAAVLLMTVWEKRKEFLNGHSASAGKLRSSFWFQIAALTAPVVILAALIPLLVIGEWSFWILTVQYLLLAAFLALRIYFCRHPAAAPPPKPTADGSDRITEGQKERVLSLLAQNRPSRLKRLSLPELLFAEEALHRQAGHDPLLEKTLRSLLLKALRKAPCLFLAVLEATGTPYLTDGTAWLFTRRTICENCIDYFSRQFLFLSRKDVACGELEDCLNELRRQGCRSLLIDNREYTVLLSLEELLSSPSGPVGQENPALQLACQEFFQALSEGRYLSKKASEVREKEERMLAEILRAKFLVPVRPNETPVREKGGSSLGIPALETQDGQRYLPVFTDLPELKKTRQLNGFSALDLSCSEVLELSQKYSGFAINPYGFNLVFHQKNLARLKSYRDTHPEILSGSSA